MAPLKIAPSLLAADFARLGEQVAAVEAAGADWLHLDVMDGHFVPNLTLGPMVPWSLRLKSELFFDTHLMISEPIKYAERFIKAGSGNITFHIEAVDDPMAVIDHIRALGAQVGICLKPKTPVERVEGVLDLVDLVLVMTVEPGFGGQSFMAEMLEKVEWLRNRLGSEKDIQVDGGIDERTGSMAVAAGANVLVAGTSIFAAKDIAAALKGLRAACDRV